MVRLSKLSKRELKTIHAKHGNGTHLLLHDVKTKQKVKIKNPLFLEHKNIVIATGHHPDDGHRIAQIVHRRH